MILVFFFSFSGVWNVPYISSAILFKGEWLKKLSDGLPRYHSDVYDPDMALCEWMRNNVCHMTTRLP